MANRRIITIACLGLVVTTAGTFEWFARDQPFTTHAHLLAKSYKQARQLPLIWLPDGRLGITRFTHKNNYTQLSFFALNTTTNTEQLTYSGPLKQLSDRFFGLFSPDGQWRLSIERHPDTATVYPTNSSSEHEKQVKIPPPKQGFDQVSTAWWNNSRGWSILWRNYDARGTSWILTDHKIGDSKPFRVHDLTFVVTARFRDEFLLQLIGFSRDGNPILARSRIAYWDSYLLHDFVEVQNATTQTTRHSPFSPPLHATRTEGEVDKCQLSPNGDHLLWLYRVEHPSEGWPIWTKRYLPWIRNTSKQHDTREFWTSNVDGTDLKRIGWADAANPLLDSSHRIWRYGWMPDGKQIYYELNGNLYSLAID